MKAIQSTKIIDLEVDENGDEVVKIYKKDFLGLEAEKEKLTRLWSDLLVRNDSLSAENVRLTGEVERLTAITAATRQYLAVKKSWDNRLPELVALNRLLEGGDIRVITIRECQLEAEITRLTAALVECQEAFENGRNVGERSAG